MYLDGKFCDVVPFWVDGVVDPLCLDPLGADGYDSIRVALPRSHQADVLLHEF